MLVPQANLKWGFTVLTPDVLDLKCLKYKGKIKELNTALHYNCLVLISATTAQA
jgi:hypothetical protein